MLFFRVWDKFIQLKAIVLDRYENGAKAYKLPTLEITVLQCAVHSVTTMRARQPMWPISEFRSRRRWTNNEFLTTRIYIHTQRTYTCKHYTLMADQFIPRLQHLCTVFKVVQTYKLYVRPWPRPNVIVLIFVPRTRYDNYSDSFPCLTPHLISYIRVS